MENWIVRIIDKGYTITRDVYIYRIINGAKEFIQNDGTCLRLSEGSAEQPKPTLELNPEALQALADELAQVGYKPQKGFIEGKLEATERHLEDTRKLLKLN